MWDTDELWCHVHHSWTHQYLVLFIYFVDGFRGGGRLSFSDIIGLNFEWLYRSADELVELL